MRRQHGLTLVELLIGLAIGLVVLGGALHLFLQSLQNSRRLLSEVRLHQDLRATVDLIARDLRRAGHWSQAVQALDQGTHNPNADVTSSAHTISYRFDSPSAASSQVNFSLIGDRIRMQIGGGTAQNLTDPDVMTVTRFDIQSRPDTLPLGHLCRPACTELATCPHIEQRRYEIRVEARSRADAQVVRALDSTVRVRNDQVTGSCPSRA
ncbi:PilW family protein [Hydrogenophaga sp. OTU3427]|uniref:PilW family protein n=1 Tax=Hydrogenophaga sp. OTU3427 TaxID=3043856 RepID=UPI00313D1080